MSSGMLKPWLPENEYYGRIIGETSAILAEDKHAKGVNQELKRVLRQLKRIDQGEMPSGRTTAERLVWIIREAARHPKYGKIIGRDCLSVVVHPDSPAMQTYYHPENATARDRRPHLVTPQLTITDVEVGLDP